MVEESAAAQAYAELLPGAGPVDHIGIAVPDLDAALEQWTGVLGLRLLLVEENAGHGVREAMLAPSTGGTSVQLLEPLSASSPVGRFLARRGPGLHHVAFRVPSMEHALVRLAELRGGPVHPVAPGVSTGTGGSRVAFLPLSVLGGTLVELVEHVQEEEQ